MATSSKPAFEGQSLEEFFASFAYKGGGGGHGDGIRKRNSSSGVRGSIDKRIGQRRILFSPNNNNNNTPPPPSPPPSSSLQSTTNRKETTMTKPPSIPNGLSFAEYIASFAYKGRRRVDNRIGRGGDLLNLGSPPPPPPVNYRKGRKTAAATAAAATTVRRVTRFFPPPAGDFIFVDVTKDITGKGKAHSGGPPPSPPPSSSLQSTTNRKETTMTKPPSIPNGLSPAEFIASFAYKGRRRVDNRIGRGEDLLNRGTPPPPPPVNYRKGRKTAAAAAAATTTVRRVTRFFSPPAGDSIFVDIKKDITGKGKAHSGGGTTRKRPRTTGNTGSTDANRQPEKRCKGRRKQRSIQLSAKEKFSDAYRRVSDHDIWDAPRSSHNLLQERHCFDPWRVLVICILLNKTNGDQVRKVLPGFFLLCPDAKSVHKGLEGQIVDKLRSLGLQNKRAGLIIELSKHYLLDDWTHVTELPGIGKYAADAYAIFAAGKLQQVKPEDHKLVNYWKEVSKMLYDS